MVEGKVVRSQKLDYNVLKVIDTELGNAETKTSYINLGSCMSWALLIPETFTAATIKVYVSLGYGEDGVTEKWVDYTETIFGTGVTTLNVAGLYPEDSYIPYRMKIVYTSSNATNHGTVHLLRNGL